MLFRSSSTPVAVSRHRSRQLNALLTQLLKVERFDVVVCDFLAAAPNVPNLKDAVLFQHNVETIIWERQAENARSVLRKALFRVQAWRMFRYERQVCQTVRQVIAVSKADSELMRSLFGIPDVQEVPTGVDVEYFARPRKTEAVADLTFVGSMDWLPNVDCIEFFCQAIDRKSTRLNSSHT